MRHTLFHALAAAAVFAFSAEAASAQPVVFRSHNTFHVKVCADAASGHARCHAHIVTDSQGRPIVNRSGSNSLPAGYGPSDLRSAYNISGTGNSNTTVAIVDAYGYNNAEADLGVYRSTYGLPPCTTSNGCFAKYNQRGQQGRYPGQNTGWAQETALDLQMASAMCPGCRIILVEANTASYSDLATAVNTAANLGAHVISNSYGGGESGSQYYEGAYNHPGVAVVASSGDSGYAGGVEFPASSPHVIAAGGTSLNRAANARGWSESAWNGAGSGCSQVYFKPTWQTDGICGGRMVADVSAVADPNTGVAVYAPYNSRGSAWYIFGGTSVASPLIGGVYGLNGGAVNAASNPYADLAGINDVTTGNNGSCGGTYYCNAGVGYDGPTGLGTPNGSGAF